MGSATREATTSSRAALAALAGGVDLATGESLFEAGRVIGSSKQLLSALADPAASADAKSALVARVFGASVTPAALNLIDAVAAVGWSRHDDLLAGIEDLGLRSVAISAPDSVSIESELFTFGTAVSSDDELELALASKLGPAPAKLALVDGLVAGKVSPQTLAILRHLVVQPRGRRIGELLRYAASVVADQSGAIVATVFTAVPLSPARLDRLAEGLAARYGRRVTINQQVDAGVIGGLRVQVGNDVIDGSIESRLNDLRLQLAG